MKDQDILIAFENFYQKMLPAKENDEKAFIWISKLPHPLFNGVFHLSTPEINTTIHSILEEFGNLPISFWLHPLNHTKNYKEALTEKGFIPIISCPLMSWNVENINTSSLSIQKSDSHSFYKILATVFHFSEEIIDGFDALLRNLEAENFELLIEGMPVAIGTLAIQNDVGGIFNIATLPEYQKKGYGKAMMQHLMNKAYNKGLKKVILMSSPDAEKLYKQLGFETHFNIDLYIK